MTVEIGINPITWTNDDMPELGGDIPLETCLAETREAGYSGTELGGKFPRSYTLFQLTLRQRVWLMRCNTYRMILRKRASLAGSASPTI